MIWHKYSQKCEGLLILFLLLLLTLWSAANMAITSKLYLALPQSPTEILDNGDFELVTGNDFDDWTETSQAGTEMLTNGGL